MVQMLDFFNGFIVRTRRMKISSSIQDSAGHGSKCSVDISNYCVPDWRHDLRMVDPTSQQQSCPKPWVECCIQDTPSTDGILQPFWAHSLRGFWSVECGSGNTWRWKPLRCLDGDRVDLMVKTSGLCHEEWVVGRFPLPGSVRDQDSGREKATLWELAEPYMPQWCGLSLEEKERECSFWSQNVTHVYWALSMSHMLCKVLSLISLSLSSSPFSLQLFGY